MFGHELAAHVRDAINASYFDVPLVRVGVDVGRVLRFKAWFAGPLYLPRTYSKIVGGSKTFLRETHQLFRTVRARLNGLKANDRAR